MASLTSIIMRAFQTRQSVLLHFNGRYRSDLFSKRSAVRHEIFNSADCVGTMILIGLKLPNQSLALSRLDAVQKRYF